MRVTPFLYPGIVGLVSSSPLSTRQTNTSCQSWDQVQESKEIQWQPCFGDFTCMRLVVPLDYANASAGTTTIAYIRQAAQINSSSAEDVLINPGGPGDSGVAEVINLGAMFAKLMPQYNIIGFDPRGVNNSGPSLSCFGDDEKSRNFEKIYSAQFSRAVDGKSERSLRYQFEAATAFGNWCTKFHENTDAKYASTAAVAQDMAHYTDLVAQANGKDPKEAKLNYYGVSYGTLLGTTFASLFPSRIGKFLLDGVADAQEYYDGRFASNQINGDEVVNDMFKYCHAAGETKCALWRNSTDEISQRTRAIIESVRQDPVPFSDSRIVPYPYIIRYEELSFIFLATLYSPLSNWPLLAKILADLERRDGSTAAQFLVNVDDTMVGATALISGLDSVKRNREYVNTYEKWTAHLGRMTNESQWTADAWAPLALALKSMEIYPPPSQTFNDTSFNVQTNAPILFVSNTHDPSTPLIGAQKMHSLFPGSALLVQDAPGHCATLSAVSNCTLGYVAQYFATGELPPPNTVCTVESVPFVTSP